MYISTKCSIAIHCLVLIGEYGNRTTDKNGNPSKLTSAIMASSTGVNAVTVRNILSALKKAGIIEVTPGTGGSRVALPPEEINLYRVCMAIEPDFLDKMIGIHPEPSQICPVGRVIHEVLDCSYRKIRDDVRSSFESITLADVLADYRRLHAEQKAAWKAKKALEAKTEPKPD